MHSLRRQMAVAEPDKSQQQALAVRHPFVQQPFVQPVSLPNLTLHTVAVDGMTETLLGHANQQLDRSVTLLTRLFTIDGPYRKSSHGTAAFSLKERIYQSLTDHPLPFAERGGRHIAYIINKVYLPLLLCQIVLQGTGHGRILVGRSLDVETQAGILSGLGRSRTEGGNGYVTLLEVGEILDE